ncbi:MAG: hypothetical protein methR_P0401 [Methyloprofundus sp.]|nr:MAG: hypothetical protein methR_P0401 [Methyloprofundus sp.]
MQFKLSYITLAVSDFAKMYAFYQALEFPLYKCNESSDDPFALFEMGGIILALYPKDLLEQQATTPISGINTAMSLSLNVVNKTQVDTFLSLAESKGATISRIPFQPEWGGYCAYFKDPEENLWEIVWHENFQFPQRHKQ